MGSQLPMSKCLDAERGESTVHLASRQVVGGRPIESPARAIIEKANLAQALDVSTRLAWRRVGETGSAESRDS